MKKLGIVMLAIVMALALSACYRADIVSELTITSADGAGTRTISAIILKDHAQSPEGPVEDNSLFFPKGVEAVRDALQAALPDGFTASLKDNPDDWTLSISFEFSDINDYNAKLKALVGESVWNDKEVADTVLTAEAVEGGHNVTVTEEKMIIDYIVEVYFKPIYENPDIYSPTRGGTQGEITFNDSFSVAKAIVNVGEDRTEVVLNEEGNLVLEISATGFVPEGGVTTPPAGDNDSGSSDSGSETPAPSTPNPQTSDSGVMVYVLLALVSVAVITVFAYRAKAVK